MSGLTVGLGMMPRGEVGLIFAGIGAKLMLDGRPVVDVGTYAAAVFMVSQPPWPRHLSFSGR
jgi:hypothetical protein